MEGRVDVLEKKVKEIWEQVGAVDSRVGLLIAKMDSVEGQLGPITEFMKEIRNMMPASNQGKNVEAGTSSLAAMEVQSATPQVEPKDAENPQIWWKPRPL